MSDAAPLAPPPPQPKAKWPRGWRRLLTELVIVVVGVGLALAAQQAAEWLRWQSEVKAARQALHAEMTVNNSYFVRRIAIASCLEKQAQEAAHILDDLEAGRTPARFTIFQPGDGAVLRDSEWEAERAAQSLTHFPRAELAVMGTYYARFSNFEIWMRDEAEAWRALNVLRRPPKALPVSELLRLRTLQEVAKNGAWIISLAAQRQLNLSRQLGIAIPPVDQERREKFCSSNIEEYRLYLNSIEQRP